MLQSLCVHEPISSPSNPIPPPPAPLFTILYPPSGLAHIQLYSAIFINWPDRIKKNFLNLVAVKMAMNVAVWTNFYYVKI